MPPTEAEWENLSLTLTGDDTPKELLTCLKDAQHLVSPNYDSESIRNIIKKSLDNYNNMNRKGMGRMPFVYTFDKDFSKMFSHLSHVTLIQLPYNDSTEAIVTLLECCVQLEELKLYGNNGTPAVRNLSLISLCGELCGTLRVLHIDCSMWNLKAVTAIYQCSLLNDLAIREAKILSCKSLLVIAQMSTLRHLHIDHCCKPLANCWISMFSYDNLKDLNSLVLEDCSFNDNVAVAIGTNLKNLTKLRMITRMPCKPNQKRYVANKGLDAIMKGCNKLTGLELCFGGWGDRQLAKTLMLIPQYLPQLRRLSAIPINTIIKWKNVLKKQMPDLLIRESLSEEFQ